MLIAANKGWRNLGISVALVKFMWNSKMKKEILSYFDNKNAGLLYFYITKKAVKGEIKLDPREVEKELGMPCSSFLSARNWLLEEGCILPSALLRPPRGMGKCSDVFTVIIFPFML